MSTTRPGQEWVTTNPNLRNIARFALRGVPRAFFRPITLRLKTRMVSRSFTFFIITASLVMMGALFTGCKKNVGTFTQTEKKDHKAGVALPSIEETKAIAEEAFIYGLPIVMNYAVMNEYCVDKDSGQYKGPFNTIVNEARVFTYKDTAIILPNSDTPYSMLWLDLRSEPMVISVPAVEKNRYYSVQLVDGNTYNYGYIGSRATGNDAGSYLVVGPDWKGEIPVGIRQVFRSSTPFALTIFRTQLFDANDMPNVQKVQSGYRAQPLSTFLQQPAPSPAPAINFVRASTKDIKSNFYEYLDAALAFVPASTLDNSVRTCLARIGIGPGKTFDFKHLSLEHKAAVLLGMKAGADKIENFQKDGFKDINCWKVGATYGDSAFFQGDWIKRAAAAKGGIYGNDAVEAMYPMTRSDSGRESLDGSKHNYTLTFPVGGFPPVNSFWSITMYDGKTQFLIENPINRYLINSSMLPGMKTNSDGSLTIYIQKEKPGPEKESNWLPAPNGPIYLVMRLYWPKSEYPSILPPGEGTWNPPGIVQAK